MPLESLPLSLVIVLLVVVLTFAVIGIGTMLWIAVRLFSIPGVVVHEFAHESACQLVGVRVLEVVYFRFGDPAGYVRHEQPARYRETFVICVAPFLVNTAVALVTFLGLAVVVGTLEEPVSLERVLSAPRETLLAGFGLAWLGLSVGMAAFPSTGDANQLWTRSRLEWKRSPLVLLGLPVVVVIYVVNVLSWLWADVLYALALLVLAFSLVGGIIP
ncbi:metalloprotease family protein [Natronolimnobius baerhuensis]|uniref:DUF3267 domain-containing protein n=1 Tax=Natronolimnobius baerhuensis TaxID=253108 RepID=A0A202E6J4_9EURY|nr:metalloprotease family protein [Natronolimnobius baerhuensis]OVE83869.1 hypothetical protein B2G88_15770 [Natronolimnobius baerhuensis]